jgi:hypothetical protein
VIVETAAGTFEVDVESGELTPTDADVAVPARVVLNLPRVVAADALGATVVAVVDAKPPILVSYDSGTTWRESGRGLPAGVAVAISEDDPDTVAYASRNRLYLSRDGGVFWQLLAAELPEIVAVSF